MDILRGLVRLAGQIEKTDGKIRPQIIEKKQLMTAYEQSGEKEKFNQAKQDRDALFIERDNIMLSTVYAFVGDPELHAAIRGYESANPGKSIDLSLMPTAEEFQGKDVFRSPLFGHARKGYEFEQQARKIILDTEQAKRSTKIEQA